METALHPLLPKTLEPAILAEWIKKNAKESYEHTKQIMFSQDEINDKAREASAHGSKILELQNIEKAVKDMIKNGVTGTAPFVLEIMPNDGVAALTTARASLDKDVRLGYYEVKSTVYGVPYAETREMVFFTSDGNEVSERNRPLSAKEVRDYVGLWSLGENGATRNGTDGF